MNSDTELSIWHSQGQGKSGWESSDLCMFTGHWRDQSDIVVNIDKLNDDESMMEENWKWLHGYKSGTSDEWKFEQA